MTISYGEEADLPVDDFLKLAMRVWPGAYDRIRTEAALRETLNICARDGSRLVGSVRILTDGYLFSTIPEIMVDPEYRRRGIGRALIEYAWRESPTGLFFGAQPASEGFFEKLGYEKGLSSFMRRKTRPSG